MLPVNTIICGDCLEVMKDWPDNCVDLVVTSPPYNANLRVRGQKYCSANYGSRIKYRSFGDDLSIGKYADKQSFFVNESLRLSKTHVIYNIQMVTGNKCALPMILFNNKESLKEIIIWDKCHAEPAISDGVLNSEYEFIFIFSNQMPLHREFAYCNFDRGTFSNVIRIPKNKDSIDGHKAIMPIDLALLLIRTFSQPGYIVFDPYAGTGTTCIAAKMLGYHWIGIDISLKDCQIARQRLEAVDTGVPVKEQNKGQLALFGKDKT